MKKLLSLFLACVAGGLFSGCAALARKEPGKGFKDPNATSEIYHDYDYRSDGSVAPYSQPRTH